MALRREDIGELLAERMDSANSIVGSGNHALTMSQATTLNVHLGSFTELKASISTLIQQYMDQEQDELVSELFSTLYVIDECLENYKGLIPAEILNAPTPSALTDSFVSINELNQYLDDSDYVSSPISRPSGPVLPDISAPITRRMAGVGFSSSPSSSSSSSSSSSGGATCSICWMDYDPEEASELQVCQFHLFCPDCLNQFLTVKVKNGDVLEITCPANGCTEKVEPEKVQKNLTGEMFEKFERFQILTRLRLEPNARFCGKSDCDGFAVGDKNDPMFPVLTCNECGGKICFNCKTNWHPDMTCKANMREVKKKTKDDDKKFDSYLKANKTIKCSKCGAGVQKNDGCNHMRCTCGYEFCWLCGETIINPGDGCYPMHYTVGACAGMQMSSVDELSMPRKAARLLINPVKYGLIATAGAVALPFYGGFKLAKVVLKD